jgi:MurNAc alpha-1-phosphate uridylyltransferase
MGMTDKIEQGFILAAGKGTRLRPYTDNTPKPLVQVDGRPLIDYIIDRMVEAGVKKIVVNTSYLSDQLEAHLSGNKKAELFVSHEPELLETGGGLKKGLSHLDDAPFFAVNGDSFWTGEIDILGALAARWQPDDMDILLLLEQIDQIRLTGAKGDYIYGHEKNGAYALQRRMEKDGTHMFTGVRILKPAVLEKMADKAFSFLKCMDAAEQQERLYGLSLQTDWHHISTPTDLDRVNEAFAQARPKKVAVGYS